MFNIISECSLTCMYCDTENMSNICIRVSIQTIAGKVGFSYQNLLQSYLKRLPCIFLFHSSISLVLIDLYGGLMLQATVVEKGFGI